VLGLTHPLKQAFRHGWRQNFVTGNSFERSALQRKGGRAAPEARTLIALNSASSSRSIIIGRGSLIGGDSPLLIGREIENPFGQYVNGLTSITFVSVPASPLLRP